MVKPSAVPPGTHPLSVWRLLWHSLGHKTDMWGPCDPTNLGLGGTGCDVPEPCGLQRRGLVQALSSHNPTHSLSGIHWGLLIEMYRVRDIWRYFCCAWHRATVPVGTWKMFAELNVNISQIQADGWISGQDISQPGGSSQRQVSSFLLFIYFLFFHLFLLIGG